jgi:transcriptional regulator with XRE-family HTH domain
MVLFVFSKGHKMTIKKGIKMTLADRLKCVREDLNKSQKEIAAQIGISFRSWQDYELGKNVPGSAVITELVKLGYNSNWILTGEGSIKERFNLELLTFIIGALDHLET